MQEYDQILPRQENSSAKNYASWAKTGYVFEGVETGRWENESAENWNVGQCKDYQRQPRLLTESHQKHCDGFRSALCVRATIPA